jgi:uncharacterized membrane protein YkvA (DUF1232 family)
MAFERSKEIARSFKRELIVYQRVLRDNRTSLSAKLFLALAIGYFCMPFDLIPDFIPVIGHLDDAIIVPALIFAALRLHSARSRFRAPKAGRPRTGGDESRGLFCPSAPKGANPLAPLSSGHAGSSMAIALPKCRIIRHNSR